MRKNSAPATFNGLFSRLWRYLGFLLEYDDIQRISSCTVQYIASRLYIPISGCIGETEELYMYMYLPFSMTGSIDGTDQDNRPRACLSLMGRKRKNMLCRLPVASLLWNPLQSDLTFGRFPVPCFFSSLGYIWFIQGRVFGLLAYNSIGANCGKWDKYLFSFFFIADTFSEFMYIRETGQGPDWFYEFKSTPKKRFLLMPSCLLGKALTCFFLCLPACLSGWRGMDVIYSLLLLADYYWSTVLLAMHDRRALDRSVRFSTNIPPNLVCLSPSLFVQISKQSSEVNAKVMIPRLKRW